MKKIILLICLNFITSQSILSQSLAWNDNIGQWTNDYPIDVDKTSDGILVTTTTAFTNLDVKGLYKFDENGNITWIFSFFDEITSYAFLGSVVDENDNIYTLLSKEGTSLESVVVNGVTIYTGISLLKINSSGVVEWDKKIGGQAEGISINYKNNNIYIIGQFSHTINVNNQITLNSNQYWDCFSFVYRYGEDYFIAKFDTSGNLQGATSFGEDYPDHLASATIDENENVYLLGSSDLHSCTVPYTHFTKYDNGLQLLWRKDLSKFSNDSELLYPSSIYISQNSKVYIWGNYFGSIVNNDYSTPAPNCRVITPFQGMFDSLMLVYDSFTGNYIKSKIYNTCTADVLETSGNHNTTAMNRASFNDLNNEELIVLTTFFNPIEFVNGTFEPSHQISKFNEFMFNENLLLFKVNKTSLDSEYIKSFTGNLSSEFAESSRDIAGFTLLDNNDYYITAAFQENPLYIFEGSIPNNSGNNNTDIAIAKLNLQNVLSLSDFDEVKEFQLYPNPFEGNIYIKSNLKIKNLKFYTIEGKLIRTFSEFEEKIDLSFLSSGIYIAKIIFDDQSTTFQKIIKK